MRRKGNEILVKKNKRATYHRKQRLISQKAKTLWFDPTEWTDSISHADVKVRIQN